MEKYHLKTDVHVFGQRVTSFPAGIDKAFDDLVKIVGGFNRSFYGISYFTADGKMAYYATAEETQIGEAEKHSCEKLTIENGEYLAVTLTDWRPKTGMIKDVFHGMLQDSHADRTKPAVEWYKNDDEMMCMIKTIEDK